MMYLNKMLSYEAAVERYGAIDIAGRHWPDRDKWLTLVEVPKVFPNFKIMDTNIPVRHISCNKDIARPLARVFDQIIGRGFQDQLFTYDGCFNIRPVRGSDHLVSAHSYGLAIDINAATNKLGERPSMSQDIVKCFEIEGFDWGGNFTRKDGMHFSYAWEG